MGSERWYNHFCVKKFLIVQYRPEKEIGDAEFVAICKYGNLSSRETERVSMVDGEIPTDLSLASYAGIIGGGGPYCLSDSEETKCATPHRWESEQLSHQLFSRAIEMDVPTLGICYSLGLICRAAGGATAAVPEYAENAGAVRITLTTEGASDPLLSEMPQEFDSYVIHKDSCTELPNGSTLLATSKQCPVHMFRLKQNIYATQFHPELDLENMLLRIVFYKHKGYFPAEKAEEFADTMRKVAVTDPMRVLDAFVEKYKSR